MSIFQLLQPNRPVQWRAAQISLLRFFVVFFLILSIPLDWKYYRDIIALDWSGFNYGVLFEISRYFPRFFGGQPLLQDLLIVLLLSVIGVGLWATIAKKEKDYDKIYYLLRVLVRYRLAIALLAYGFIKIWPIQSPYPSITLLNTPYGDLSAWKIFTLSLGIVPDYQSFLGGFEVLAALLLFNRKTASIGAFIAILFTGNVVMSNLAYEGGEFVYSGYLTLYAFFIFAHDLPKFYSLLFLRQKTYPENYRLAYNSPLSQGRAGILKSAFIFLFVFVYGTLVLIGHSNGLDKYPKTKGIPGLAGVYDVAEFIYGEDTLAYGVDHPVRWKKVVFEEWATLSIQSDQPVTVDNTNIEYVALEDSKRKFESEGIKGWHFYEYHTDKGEGEITLKNRNPHHSNDNWNFTLDIKDKENPVIKGQDATGKHFHAVLNKSDKKYLLQEAANQGRRARIEL